MVYTSCDDGEMVDKLLTTCESFVANHPLTQITDVHILNHAIVPLFTPIVLIKLSCCVECTV